MAITGRIIKIIPVTVYEGKAYDYNVIIELANGVNITVFVHPPLIVKSDIGDYGEFEIIAILPKIVEVLEKTNECRFQVIPSLHKNNPYAEIYGKIVDFVKDDAGNKLEILIEIGNGIINLNPFTYSMRYSSREDGSIISNTGIILKKGDCIHVEGSRLDLRSIKPIDSQHRTI